MLKSLFILMRSEGIISSYQETAFPICAKEVVLLSTRERILTIRLLEKVTRDPVYAEALGIEDVNAEVLSDLLTNSECMGKCREHV